MGTGTDDGLAVVLSEFARTLVTDFPIQGILDHLVVRIVDILPIDAAGVSLISPTTHPRLIAGSDESAIRYEHLQTTLGEGPCLAAYETDEAISIPDLNEDDRFPVFAKSALAEGLVAVFTFPLRNDDHGLGALDLYRTTAGALDERDMVTAQTLADVATAYLLNAEYRKARNDFVATVSHELRTPMTSIAGFVELLQDRSEGPLTSGQERFIDAISRNGYRLTALANDLLTIASLESPKDRRPHVELDLGFVVRTALHSIEPVIAARRLTVTFEVPEEPAQVLGDALELEAVVVNLMTNALKFTKDGGWVNCELRTFAGAARLEVTDNGLGIPQAEQRELFTRFFRSSTAQEHAIQGTGLGLTIVDSIVRSHNGNVSVESAHLEGSTFTVTIPLRETPAKSVPQQRTPEPATGGAQPSLRKDD
jgi:signal transduction histidine kinase